MFVAVTSILLLLGSAICAVPPRPPPGFNAPYPPELHTATRNVSDTCLLHVSHWMSQLRNSEQWALHMLDSATKTPSGVIIGNHNHLGNFDQCLAVSVHDDVADFEGQFCRAWMDVDVPGHTFNSPGMVYAFCLPSSCTPEEMPELFKNHLGPSLGVTVYIDWVNPNDCHVKGESINTLGSPGVVAISLLSVLAFVVVISALLEWWLPDKTPEVLRAFSVTNTCRGLFNISKHPADISCLHGIRIGSMLWVIIGHRYGQERWFPMSNPDIFNTYFKHPLTMLIVNAMPSVDTFFFLSGLLMCTSFLSEMKRKKEFDVILFYVYRYLRLSVPMAVVILIYASLMPLTGDGPLWNNYFFHEARGCKANWWTNLVYVNNIISQEGFGGCLGQTWYTAVDMQLAWLSPLVLLPLYYSRKAGLQLMGLLILISCFIPFTVTYIWKFYMTSLHIYVYVDPEGVPPGGNHWEQVYAAAQCRATPYLCGILLGYYLYQTKNQKLHINKIWVVLGWILNTAICLAIIFGLFVCYKPDYVYDRVGSAFYAGFFRLGWSVGLSWIVVACVNGYGGPVDKILSWRIMLPISRLNYGAFLLHMVPMVYDSSVLRTTSFFSDYNSVHSFLADAAMTYFLAFLLYVLVEGPLMSLMKIAFGKAKKPPSKENMKNGITLTADYLTKKTDLNGLKN